MPYIPRARDITITYGTGTRIQGCYNLLTTNPKEYTPYPEIFTDNTVIIIPNLHIMLMKQN